LIKKTFGYKELDKSLKIELKDIKNQSSDDFKNFLNHKKSKKYFKKMDFTIYSKGNGSPKIINNNDKNKNTKKRKIKKINFN
jgi:hypothetical protein